MNILAVSDAERENVNPQKQFRDQRGFKLKTSEC